MSKVSIGSGTVVAISGTVQVTHYSGNVKIKTVVYDATGVSKKGSLRDAITNMRLNAMYKYMYEHNIGSNANLKTRVRTYKIDKREQKQYITKRFKKTVKGKGKYYYITREKNSGKIISSGKWRLISEDVEEIIDSQDEE